MDIPTNVLLEVMKLIPASITNDLACFVFYDNHPKDEKNLDITVCTTGGEVKEFFQRDLISSIKLSCRPTDIKITRKGTELYYTVTGENEINIISSKNVLEIVKKIDNVQDFDFVDDKCSGQATLKVIKTDDAVPLLYNNNFERLDDKEEAELEGDVRLASKLQQKLVESKFTTKSNEDMLNQYLKIRQNVTWSLCQNLHPDLNDSAFKNDSMNITGELKLISTKPHVTVCNGKLLLILDVVNGYNELLEEIHILLDPTGSSLVSSTKIFKKRTQSPYWLENISNSLEPNLQYAVVAVMDMKEVKYNVSRIELAGCISYMKSKKEYLMPFDDVLISSLKSMGDEFDALSNFEEGHQNHSTTTLAILSSTYKTELHLKHIKNPTEQEVALQDLFCVHLHMDRMYDNVVVYRKSPYHVLNGVMMVFDDTSGFENCVVWVYTRSKSQVLALLHCINDAVPSKIIATTPKYTITAKNNQSSQFRQENNTEKYNYKEYARTMLKRSAKVLDYLDDCMKNMSQSKDPKVLSKIGSEIDLFAGGIENFKAFRNGLLEETSIGIELLMKSDLTFDSAESDVMIIDD